MNVYRQMPASLAPFLRTVLILPNTDPLPPSFNNINVYQLPVLFERLYMYLLVISTLSEHIIPI